MRIDIFDDDDRIIDHQANRRGYTSQGHQIETEPRQPHGQKRDQHRHRNYQNGDEGGAPVAQEYIKDHYRKQQPDGN